MSTDARSRPPGAAPTGADQESTSGFSPSRRGFLKGAGGIAAASGFAGEALAAQDEGGAPKLEGSIDLVLDVNDEARAVKVEPRTTLLNALRNHMEPAMTGTKLVCDHGTCGACTVLVDGEPVYSCMTLAVAVGDRKVRTVEGLASNDGELSVVQEAFCEHDASMCGFCTPGFLMSITACLERKPDASEDEVRAACSGNFCRCGTQPQIFRAALDAGRKLAGGKR